MTSALNQPNRRSAGRSERTSAASPLARTKVVRMSAGPTRTVAARRRWRGPRAAFLSLPRHAVEEMDGLAQAQAEGDGQSDDPRELQAVAEKPQQLSCGQDRKDTRHEAGEADADRAEREANESGDEGEFHCQSLVQLVNHVR